MRTRRCSAKACSSRRQTEAVVSAYRTIIDRIADEQLRANVALKLTHLGLDISEELAHDNLRTARRARHGT